MRGVGIVETLRSLLPGWAYPVFEWITRLGDPALVLLISPPLYWFGARYGLLDRRDGVRLIGVALGALSLTVALKAGFGLPRPPDDLWRIQTDGHGFPSGHATGSTAVYGAVALLLDRWRRRTRVAAAGTLVAAIALSRVVLGVHFLVDVVAGVALGTAYLLAVLYASEERPGVALWVAVVMAVGAVAVTGFGTEATILLAGSVGAAVAWALLPLEDLEFGAPHPLVALATVGLLGAGAATQLTAAWVPVLLAVNAVAGAAVVALPALRRFRGSGLLPSR